VSLFLTLQLAGNGDQQVSFNLTSLARDGGVDLHAPGTFLDWLRLDTDGLPIVSIPISVQAIARTQEKP